MSERGMALADILEMHQEWTRRPGWLYSKAATVTPGVRSTVGCKSVKVPGSFNII